MLPDVLDPTIDVPAWVSWLLIAGAVVAVLRSMFRIRVVAWLTGLISDALAAALAEKVRAVVQEETETIRHELQTNHGFSLRDVADRTERKLDAHLAWSRRIIDVNDLAEPPE